MALTFLAQATNRDPGLLSTHNQIWMMFGHVSDEALHTKASLSGETTEQANFLPTILLLRVHLV
jgi:hypothetical protein